MSLAWLDAKRHLQNLERVDLNFIPFFHRSSFIFGMREDTRPIAARTNPVGRVSTSLTSEMRQHKRVVLRDQLESRLGENKNVALLACARRCSSSCRWRIRGETNVTTRSFTWRVCSARSRRYPSLTRDSDGSLTG
jgi:hypothetical protein